MSRRAGAKRIGAPPGQALGSFGELRSFTLPRCGLGVSYSTTRRGDPRVRKEIVPDVLAPMTSSDWFAGRDPVLEVLRER